MMKPNFFYKYPKEGYSDCSVKIEKVTFDENFLLIQGSTYDGFYYNSKINKEYKTTFSYKVDLSKLSDQIIRNGQINANSNSINFSFRWERWGFKYGSYELLDFNFEQYFTSSTNILYISSSIEPDI